VDFQEDPFPGSGESDKKVDYVTQFADNYWRFTTKLTFVLAEKVKVKNVNSQKCPSHTAKIDKRSCIPLPVTSPLLLTDRNKE
jgi:hypothetical protein